MASEPRSIDPTRQETGAEPTSNAPTPTPTHSEYSEEPRSIDPTRQETGAEPTSNAPTPTPTHAEYPEEPTSIDLTRQETGEGPTSNAPTPSHTAFKQHHQNGEESSQQNAPFGKGFAAGFSAATTLGVSLFAYKQCQKCKKNVEPKQESTSATQLAMV